ncbi:HIT domain-containing protein [Streptomyces sp. NPDC096033]|uniref:HIT domain-containing protein n=1 Tax=Streptomyces sp. NPDC096033 TaxID=3366071 RepID=UPI003830EB54
MSTDVTVSDFYCHKVLTGQVEIRQVMETERVLAFHHTNPSYPVHIVVIPKEHVPSLIDLGGAGPDLLAEVVGVVRDVAAQVEAERGACSVVTNLGLYQESKHMHWHVLWRGEREIRSRYGHHDV